MIKNKRLLTILGLVFLIVLGLYFWQLNRSATTETQGSETLTSGAVIMTTTPGITNNRLNPCIDRDNCRNSDDPQEKFRVAPIADPDGSAWDSIPAVMARLKRVQSLELGDDYMHFTQTSAFFRFVDDIEFHRRLESGEIAVRSASRLGYRDFGVNQERIDVIRSLLSSEQSD